MNKLTRRALLGGAGLAGAAGVGGLGWLLAAEGSGLVPGTGRARAVANSPALPAQVDTVVIGGGNIGCMTALTLAERGVRVALCEKGVIAGEASGRSLGYIDSQLLDPTKMPFIHRSKALWTQMNERVQAETGYVPSGLLTCFPNQEFADFGAMWLDMVRDAPGADSRMLTAQEAAAMTPGTAMSCVGALYSPDDACAEPKLFAPAVADALKARGGFVFQQCAVRGIERAGGRVSAVITEQGRIACSTVVLAGGVWSPVLARSLGLDIPQFMGFSNVAHVGAAAGGPRVALITDNGVVMRRTLDDGYDICIPEATTPLQPSMIRHLPRLWPAIENMWAVARPALNVGTFMAEWRIPDRWALDGPSPFEQNRILQPARNDAQLEAAVAAVRVAVPALRNAPVLDRWSGALMSTLDNMPVLSAADGLPGLFLGTGFYYGLTMAPAAGEALADLVMGRTPKLDLALYRYRRFHDGSPIKFRF